MWLLHASLRAGRANNDCNTLRASITVELAARMRARYPKAEAEVYKLYQERRARGLPVSGHWLRCRLRCAVRTKYTSDPRAQVFVASRKYVMLFARRFQLVKRKKTNCKKLRCESCITAKIVLLHSKRLHESCLLDW